MASNHSQDILASFNGNALPPVVSMYGPRKRTAPPEAIHACSESNDSGSVISAPYRTSFDFWWRTTGEVLSRLLEKTACPPHLRQSYITFYSLSVIPELGPDPASRIALSASLGPQCSGKAESFLVPKAEIGCGLPLPVTSGSAELEATRSPALRAGSYYPSFMTDDHCPVEFSCVFDTCGKPVIRFTIDPIVRQECKREPAIKLFEDYGANLKLASDDLVWCRICAEELTMVAPDLEKLEPARRPRYPSQYFAAFELSGSLPSMKAYFSPETVAAVTGVPKSILLMKTVERLKLDNPGLTTAWNTTNNFLESLPSHLKPCVEGVAVDCVPSHKNRLKIYLRSPSSTLATIKRFMTLDGTVPMHMIAPALELITVFWRLLFGDISEDSEPTVGEACTHLGTSNVMFYYELRGDSPLPRPKVYIPVQHFCRDDGQIVEAMTSLHQAHGNTAAARQYGDIIRETFTHRALSSRTGIHTYIALAAKGNEVDITAYYNPECFRWGDNDQ